MTHDQTTLSITILGKLYQIKCKPTETQALQKAALYLEEKMRALIGEHFPLNLEGIAIVTALNITHQLLAKEADTATSLQQINERITALNEQIDTVL